MISDNIYDMDLEEAFNSGLIPEKDIFVFNGLFQKEIQIQSKKEHLYNAKIIRITTNKRLLDLFLYKNISATRLWIDFPFTLTAQEIRYMSDDSVFPLLMEIYVSKNHPYYESVDGVLYSKGRRALIFCPHEKQEITIDEDTEIICSFAFANNRAIRQVLLPDSVTDIGQMAFANMKSLKYFQFGAGITKAGSSYETDCFTRNRALECVRFHDNVRYIGKAAFSFCSSLKEIELPEKLETMDENAFYTSGISSVILPSSVSEIGECSLFGVSKVEISSEKFIPKGLIKAICRCMYHTSNDVVEIFDRHTNEHFYFPTVIKKHEYIDTLSDCWDNGFIYSFGFGIIFSLLGQIPTNNIGQKCITRIIIRYAKTLSDRSKVSDLLTVNSTSILLTYAESYNSDDIEDICDFLSFGIADLEQLQMFLKQIQTSADSNASAASTILAYTIEAINKKRQTSYLGLSLSDI